MRSLRSLLDEDGRRGRRMAKHEKRSQPPARLQFHAQAEHHSVRPRATIFRRRDGDRVARSAPANGAPHEYSREEGGATRDDSDDGAAAGLRASSWGRAGGRGEGAVSELDFETAAKVGPRTANSRKAAARIRRTVRP